MACGIIPPLWANLISDSRLDGYMAECVRTDGSHNWHVFRTPEGKLVEWGDDPDCQCEDCLYGDGDRNCILHREITEAEFKQYSGQT